MGEWEEKLNSILEDTDTMSQIMALARSLTGEKHEDQVVQEQREAEMQKGTLPDLSDLMGQLDPDLIQKGLRVVQGLQEKDDRSAALLIALKPFLRQDRQKRIDRAVQALQMTRMVHLFLGNGTGKEGDEGV